MSDVATTLAACRGDGFPASIPRCEGQRDPQFELPELGAAGARSAARVVLDVVRPWGRDRSPAPHRLRLLPANRTARVSRRRRAHCRYRRCELGPGGAMALAAYRGRRVAAAL